MYIGSHQKQRTAHFEKNTLNKNEIVPFFIFTFLTTSSNSVAPFWAMKLHLLIYFTKTVS